MLFPEILFSEPDPPHKIIIDILLLNKVFFYIKENVSVTLFVLALDHNSKAISGGAFP